MCFGASPTRPHVSCALNSLKRIRKGDYIAEDYRVIKGDTRSLDYSSYNPLYNPSFHVIFHFCSFDAPLL